MRASSAYGVGFYGVRRGEFDKSTGQGPRVTVVSGWETRNGKNHRHGWIEARDALRATTVMAGGGYSDEVVDLWEEFATVCCQALYALCLWSLFDAVEFVEQRQAPPSGQAGARPVPAAL